MSTYTPTEVLAKTIEESVIDVRLRNAVTLDLLASKGRVRSVDYSDIFWDVVVSGSGTSVVPMTTAGVAQTTGQTVQATLGLGQFKLYHQFDLNRVALKNASARAPGALKQQLQFHVRAGLLALRRQINQFIWTADGTAAFGGMVGMQQVLLPTATYANINPVTFPIWAPVLNTNATPRALTKAIIYDFQRVKMEQEVMSDSVVTSPITAQTYNVLFDTLAGNFQFPSTLGGSENRLDLAPSTRYLDGAPIIEDPMCPAGQIVTFDSQQVELISFDLANADSGTLSRYGMKDNFETISSAEIGGLRVNVALLPQANPGIITFQMFVLPQLVVYHRRMVQAINQLT
jgi:hypothetical protein